MAVFGFAGEDTGPWLVGCLEGCGVDASEIRFDAVEPTGFTVAATTPEDRAFLTYGGANRLLPTALAAATGNGWSLHARHVHLACSPVLDGFPDLVDAVHRAGSTVSLDVGWHEDWLRDARALAGVARLDIFFPNELESRAMTGETDPERALRRFAEAGAKAVALKLGPGGAALLWGGQILFAPGLPVNAVDATGAGDCFDAGFLHAFLAGAPPEVCLRTANICGALSTERYGGIAGFPSPERVESELKRQS